VTDETEHAAKESFLGFRGSGVDDSNYAAHGLVCFV